jgi:hypothetical protein
LLFEFDLYRYAEAGTTQSMRTMPMSSSSGSLLGKQCMGTEDDKQDAVDILLTGKTKGKRSNP